VVQVTPQNVQTPTPVFRYDTSQKTYLPVAIEIGTVANRVFLSLYGTGFRPLLQLTARIFAFPG
jgi:hypothetical protein